MTESWVGYTVLLALVVVVGFAAPVPAGSQSDPEISDDVNDVEGSTGSQIGQDDPTDDWADLVAVWFTQPNATHVQVSIEVVSLPPTQQDDTDLSGQTSVTYTVDFTYHSPAAPGFSSDVAVGYTLTASPAVGGGETQYTCSFDGNDVAVSRDSDAVMSCAVPASMISTSARNSTLWEGDMLMEFSAAASQSQPQYSDTAEGNGTYLFTLTQARPQDTGGGIGNGNGTGNQSEGPPITDGGESTPGFGPVVAAAALVAVAWFVKRRR